MPTYNITSTTGGIVPTNVTGDIARPLLRRPPIMIPRTDVGGPDYNLVFTSATNTWSWSAAGHSPAAGGAGATNGTYGSETFIVNNENEVSIDLDSDGIADVTYTFTTPLIRRRYPEFFHRCHRQCTTGILLGRYSFHLRLGCAEH